MSESFLSQEEVDALLEGVTGESQRNAEEVFEPGEVRSYDLFPAALGLEGGTLDDLRGGDPATNARLAHEILSGGGGPKAAIVALNAAAGLLVGGLVDDFPSGIELARASLTEGKAAAALEKLVAVSQAAKADEAGGEPG